MREMPSGSAAMSRERLQRRTMIILVITQIVGTVGVGVAPSIGVLLAGEVTQNEAWAGLARSFSTFGAALLGLPLGNLAARRGRRVALSTGWGTAALGSALLVVAAQDSLLVPLFIGLLLIGAGSAVSLQSRFAATDLALTRNKAKSLSLIVWVGTLGSVLGPNLGVPGRFVGEATGLNLYASSFLIAAVCLGLAGLLVVVLLRPDPLLRAQADSREALTAEAPAQSQPTASEPAASELTTQKPSSRRRDPARKPRGSIGQIMAELKANTPARYAVIAILTAQIVMVSIMTMTPVHIEHQGGSIEIVGVTISLHILGMYALSPLVGWTADTFGHRATISAGIAIFLASLVIGALLPNGTAWIMVSLILLGLGWSFVNVAASALFSAVVSDEVKASSQGGVDATSNLCGATAAFIAGPLLAVTSFSVLSYIAMAVLVPLIVLTVGGSGRSVGRKGDPDSDSGA